MSAAAAQLTKGASLALPISIAPFTVAVIGPKPGAVDSDQETALTEELARKLDLVRSSTLLYGQLILYIIL